MKLKKHMTKIEKKVEDVIFNKSTNTFEAKLIKHLSIREE